MKLVVVYVLDLCILGMWGPFDGLVWCGVVWFGVLWFGLAWFGLVWFGLVWCGAIDCTGNL